MAKRLIQRDERGVTAVEFGLILPALLTLIIGTTQMGKLFFSNADMLHAVGAGARVAHLSACQATPPSSTRSMRVSCAATPMRAARWVHAGRCRREPLVEIRGDLYGPRFPFLPGWAGQADRDSPRLHPGGERKRNDLHDDHDQPAHRARVRPRPQRRPARQALRAAIPAMAAARDGAGRPARRAAERPRVAGKRTSTRYDHDQWRNVDDQRRKIDDERRHQLDDLGQPQHYEQHSSGTGSSGQRPQRLTRAAATRASTSSTAQQHQRRSRQRDLQEEMLSDGGKGPRCPQLKLLGQLRHDLEQVADQRVGDLEDRRLLVLLMATIAWNTSSSQMRIARSR